MTKMEPDNYFNSIKRDTEVDIKCPMCGQMNRFDVATRRGPIQCDNCAVPLAQHVEQALQDNPSVVNAVQEYERMLREKYPNEPVTEEEEVPPVVIEKADPIKQEDVEKFHGKPKGKGKDKK